MTENHTLRIDRLVPLSVVIVVAFVVAVFYPIPGLIVPSAVFLAGLAGLMSSIYLHAQLQLSTPARLSLAMVNFVMTTGLVFIGLRALVQVAS